jgi:RHS repeat-associated protein
MKFTPPIPSCSTENFCFHAGDYSFGFNGKDKESEFNSGAYDFGARIHDARLGRWMSVDPKATKYPGFSCYSSNGNSPLYFVDKAGEENIVYLIYVTPKSNKKAELTPSELKDIKKAMEKQMENMMTRTKVVVYQGNEPFDPNNMDKTDTYILIGDAKDCAEYSKINKLEEKGPKDEKGKLVHKYNVDTKHIIDDTDVLETTSCGSGDAAIWGGGIGGIISTDRLRKWASETAKISFTDAMTLTALHVAFAHNTNYVDGGHNGKFTAPLSFDACRITIMLNPDKVCVVGGSMKDKNDFPKKDVGTICFESAMDKDFYKAIQHRFGMKKAVDNYDSNKKKKK